MAAPAQKRAALESHRVLGKNLESLRSALLQSGTSQAEGIEALYSTSMHHWENLAEYLSATVQARYYNEIIPPQSTAAQRTFAVPELFEMIMDYLPIPRILAMAQTCRDYKTRIDNSQRMQIALCLQAAPVDSPFRARFWTSLALAPGGGFYCKPPVMRSNRSGKTEDGKHSIIDICAAFLPQGDEQRLPRIGPTYRRMFVTQPPVKEMTATAHCCEGLWESIRREAGVTIGDIYDFVAAMIEKHRWCPHEARNARMLPNGQVDVLIDFCGKLTLRYDDPIVKKFEKKLVEKRNEQKRAEVTRLKKTMYSSAKKVAHGNGLPIPTMPEWLEANPQWIAENAEETSQLYPRAAQAVTIPIDAFSFS